jgi:hypothetical protein
MGGVMIVAKPVSPNVGAAGEPPRSRAPDRRAPADVAEPRAAAIDRRHQAFDERPKASVGALSPAAALAPTAPTTVNSP